MTDTSTTNLLFERMMTTVRTYLEASPELGEIRICTYGVNGGELKQVAIKSAQRLQLIEQRRENRREAGRKIDPASAFVTVAHRYLLDPYDDGDFIPPEVRCLGAVEFARAPDSDEWIDFADLPEATADALRKQPYREPPRQDDDLPF
jgi:hypothetical protein